MRKLVKHLGSILFTIGLLCVSAQSIYAEGTGGFRIYATDAEFIGKGGAFVGEADNASAVLYNSAGMTQLKGSDHLSIGMTGIQPRIKHTSTAGVESQARISTFMIPSVFYVNDFDFDNVVFGIGTTSSWGLGTEWNEDSFSAYHATRSEIENIDTVITGAYKFSDQLSLGAGVHLAYSKLNKEKQIFQGSNPNADGQLKADAGAVGYKLAALFKHDEMHQFGLTYKSEIKLKYEGELTANGFIDGGGTPYRALFGDSSYSTEFETKLTLPQSVVFGYSFTPNNNWRFNFDVDWTDWSSVVAERVSFPNETNGSRIATLNLLTDSNRDWKSTVSFQVGSEYNWNNDLSLRGGYFYHPTPIPKVTFDSSVPIADVHGVNLGFGYDVNEDVTINMAWTGMIYEDISVNNAVGNALTANLDGKYENFTNIITLTLNWEFN